MKYSIPLPIQFVSYLSGKKVKSVLDVGYGYGRSCFYLANRQFQVFGIDIDKASIREAFEESRRINCATVRFLQNAAQTLCFEDEVFDAVTLLGVLTFVERVYRPLIIGEVFRVLKSQGYIYLEDFGQTWNNPVYSQRYCKDFNVTREWGTFTVNDEDGKFLHFAHHFTPNELLYLLKPFEIIAFDEAVFTSYYHKNWVRGYSIIAQKK